MPETDARPLAGLRILVTRPAHQAEPLCAALTEAGAEAIRFPTLAITAAPADPARMALWAQLAEFQLAIFISANAVEYGLKESCQQGPWPTSTRLAAVGRRSAEALHREGFKRVLVPAQHYDSEALLELPELASVQGQRVLIVRGEGGRECLADSLRGRGAEVHYAEVYRRVVPSTDPAALLARWQAGGLDAVTVTSEQSLRNLFKMVGASGQAWVQQTTLIVPSERVAQAAQALGCGEVRVADSATDEAMLAALGCWRAGADPARAQ